MIEMIALSTFGGGQKQLKADGARFIVAMAPTKIDNEP